MKIKKIEAQQQEVKKLRVAAYCRVSTDQDDQKESLEAQKQHYESWICSPVSSPAANVEIHLSGRLFPAV